MNISNHLFILEIRKNGNVGVSVEHTYEVKKIDTDFFVDGF